MRLTNSTILITGGGSGIGRGLAEALHRLGNQVIISGRRQQLLDQVVDANPGMKAICFDVPSTQESRRAVGELLQDFPSLNGLIINDGIMPLIDPSNKLADSDIERVTETNFVAPIRLTSYLISLDRRFYTTHPFWLLFLWRLQRSIQQPKPRCIPTYSVSASPLAIRRLRCKRSPLPGLIRS